MKKRTEEEKITQATFPVILGGKEYGIKPLVIRDSREWRKKVIALIVPLPDMIKTTIYETEDFGEVLTQILIGNPEKVLDLFFEYAKDLNRDEIEGVATDAELNVAFLEVTKITFPLAESLPKVMARLIQ